MPLDAASHLASQGWGGAGKPLRAGPNALSRPIVGVQKKTLGGVGQDRDEAFAFWDHVYSVSASTISIKIHNDSDTDEESSPSPPPCAPSSSTNPPPAPATQLDRTSTGLISNRRPTASSSAVSSASTSGSSTPVTADSPRVSVMAAAKKQAARLELYRRFYVGPVIGPEHGDQGVEVSESPSPAETVVAVDELDAEAERKAARRAAKAAKRERKEEKRRRKAEKAALKEQAKTVNKGKSKSQGEEVQEEGSTQTGQKRKRGAADDDEAESTTHTDTKGKPASPGRKKKRVKLIMSEPPPFVKHTPSLKPCDKKGILRTPVAESSSSGSEGEKSKKVTFTKTVISHTVERWWEEAGWSDDGL